MQRAIDHINLVMRENLLGIKIVKSYVLEKQQYDSFQTTNEQVKQASINAQHSVIILSPIVTVVLNISVVAALWFGGRLHTQNLISDGQIIAFVNYMIQITNAMINTIDTVSSLSRAQTATIRIREILNLPHDAPQSETVALPAANSIQFDHVSFAYPDAENVLTDINFNLKDGQKLGIIGTTGSGKTTLVDLLTRLYDVTTGSIKVGGININDLTLSQLRHKIAVAPKTSTLFSGTIASNLRYGSETATTTDLKRAAQTAAADEFISTREQGLEAPVTQRGNNFSGGQKQRLNIARALVAKPDVLILDDVTSAVDLATDARIQRALRQDRKGKTTVTIAQRISSIIDSDLILVLDQGRLVAQGTHAQLLQSSPFYQEVAQTQLGGGQHA